MPEDTKDTNTENILHESSVPKRPLMEKDRKDSLVSVAIHTIAGVVIGYISLSFGGFSNALGLAVVVLIILGFVVQKVSSTKRDRKWWLGNGGIIYLFVWIVSWILFFNLA